MSYTVIDSPIDQLTLVARDDVLSGVYMEEHRHRPDTTAFGREVSGPEADRVFGPVIRQLDEYFSGARTSFDLVTSASGTAFQQAVWAQLAAIPYGQTITYAELAARIGNPKAVRAVGLANGRNPLSIVVPCHRVIGASGALTGFGGGIERKRFLLELENALPSPATDTGHTALWEDDAVQAPMSAGLRD